MGAINSSARAGKGRKLKELVPDPDLQHARLRAEKRLGRIPAEGRYHRLPQRLVDDYILEGKPLGTGYNGTVYSAVNRLTRVPYAVKTLNLKGLDAQQKKELVAEVEIFLSLDHPHVARLMEVFESETQVHLVMEFMKGGELYKRVMERKSFAEEDAAEAARQMLFAVAYIHREGVVHRDLKLENFMYDSKDGDFLKLIDFGFSKLFEPRRRHRMHDSLGTITYVAPEVLAKSYRGGTCDMWSFGVIMFALLSGYLPFTGRNNNEIIAKIQSGKYEMDRKYWKNVSASGVDFVKKLLVVDPDQRLTAEQALAHPWIVGAKRRAAVRSGYGLQDTAGERLAEAFVRYGRAPRFHQACAQLMGWSLSADERAALRGVYLDFDHDGAGVLRLSEVEEMLRRRMGDGDDFDKVLQAIEALDVDHDGELHYTDFLAAMVISHVGSHRDALRAAFRKLDRGSAGAVTCEDLGQMLQPAMTSGEIEAYFREADADGDGTLSEDEFFSFVSGGPIERTTGEVCVVKGCKCSLRGF